MTTVLLAAYGTIVFLLALQGVHRWILLRLYHLHRDDPVAVLLEVLQERRANFTGVHLPIVTACPTEARQREGGSEAHRRHWLLN